MDWTQVLPGPVCAGLETLTVLMVMFPDPGEPMTLRRWPPCNAALCPSCPGAPHAPGCPDIKKIREPILNQRNTSLRSVCLIRFQLLHSTGEKSSNLWQISTFLRPLSSLE